MAAEIQLYVEINAARVTKVAPPRPSSTDAASARGRPVILSPMVVTVMNCNSM